MTEKITKNPPPVPSKSFLAKRPNNPPVAAPAGHAESAVERKDVFKAPKAFSWKAYPGLNLGQRKSGSQSLYDIAMHANDQPPSSAGTPAPRSAEEIAELLEAMRSA